MSARSPMPDLPTAAEFFYLDADGTKQDAALHAGILNPVDFPIDEKIMAPIRARNRAEYVKQRKAETRAVRWRLMKARIRARLAKKVDFIQGPESGLLGGSYPQGGGDDIAVRDKHPGEGYSEGSYVSGGVIHTSDVNDAVRALHEDRRVELNQPRQVTVLIDKLGEITKSMILKGEAAPKFNLCNVTVKGTNLFCADAKGIPRVQMPQIPKERDAEFLKHLEDKGYKVELK